MAKHEIQIHENTSATKATAPYLGTYVTKETKKTDNFASALSEKSGLPVVQAQAILAGCVEVIEELEKEQPVRINVDGGKFACVINGSFATSDAAFDATKNALLVTFSPDEDVRLALVNETPVIVTDETMTKVRLDHVMDVENPRPYEVVYGQNEFKVTGFNLVTTDEGAVVYLENKSGAIFNCTVTEVTSKQVFCAKSDALLEAGDYKLVVKSRGGDAEGELQTVFRKVKYLKVVLPPTLVRAGSSSGILEIDWGTVYGAENVNLEGTAFAYKAGDKVTIADASHTWTFTGDAIASATDTAMELNYMKATREDGQEAFAPEEDCTLTITYQGATLQVAYKANRM